MTILERLGKLTDFNYLLFAMTHYPRKIIIQNNLRRLSRYHSGKSIDFTRERNLNLAQILSYASQNCRYYQKLFAEVDLNLSNIVKEFSKIPFLDKSIIRSNVQDIISTRLQTMQHGTRNTGGSTGEPLEFFTSINYDMEHQEFLYKMMGYKRGNKILAMDGSSIMSDITSNNIYWTKKADDDLPYGSMALSSLYLTESTISHYIDFINAFQPSIIRGYPAFINDVATYILNNKENMNCTIKGIVLTSESANNEQIQNIAKAFKTKIFLQYGHAEAAIFAYTIDESYEYYCSPFYGYVEIVNDSGMHVKPGELGEVVVTGFYNYAMPFVRYKTGDLAVFSESRDGIVRLTSVIGRTQDYIYNADNEKTLLTALVFGMHYKAFAHIKKWQIVQDKPGEVIIKIVKDELFDERDQEEIRNNFLSTAKVTTSFVYVDSIPLTKRGKFMFLLQNIKY